MARTPRRRTGATTQEGGQPPERRPRANDNLPRPAATAPSAALARPQAPTRRKNPFGFLRRITPRFAGDVISELRKVTWPTIAETRYLTVVVAIVALTMGIILGLFDLAFGWMIEQLFFD